MLLANALRTWTRRSTCRFYSYGLLPQHKLPKRILPEIPEDGRDQASDHGAGASSFAAPLPTARDPPISSPAGPERTMDTEALKRQRQIEWKRRQAVSVFVMIPIGKRALSVCLA